LHEASEHFEELGSALKKTNMLNILLDCLFVVASHDDAAAAMCRSSIVAALTNICDEYCGSKEVC
jgi:hypothetical protein